MTISPHCIVQPSITHAKVGLIRIGDRVDAGLLNYRDQQRARLLPSSRLPHWAERFFESHYLRMFCK